jgi:hypothetical protein
MKTLVTIFAVASVLAFTVPAFAQTIDSAKTQADCEKAGGIWSGHTGKRGGQ